MLKELCSTNSGYIAKGSGKALRKPYDNHRKLWISVSVGCFLELKFRTPAVSWKIQLGFEVGQVRVWGLGLSFGAKMG